MQLINTDELKKWLERWKGYLDDDMIQRMQICVKDIPTIEERKKGKWIPYSKVYECRYNCSLCGYDLMGIHESEAKFCPNCGADMRNVTDIGNENEKHN